MLDDVDADVVVGFGGYVALPAYLAARGLPCRPAPRRIPVVIHEANARAGLANRVGAHTADRVLSAVPDSGLRRAEVVGVPVRASIAALDRAVLRAEARAHFGFPDDARVLLVFGGSQGAVSLNRAVSGAAADLAAAGVCVLHAHGPQNVLELRRRAQGDPPYVAVPYLDRMELAYAAADLVICRAGAMTVAEVSAVGLPAIYVPLPIGNGEQRLNALPVVNAGGGMVVADAALTPELVARQVAGLLTDPARLAAMTAPHARVGHRDAAGQVARAALASPPGPVPGQRREHRAVAARSAAGAHGRHRRSWHVGHRPILLDRGGLVSGSDAKESRGVHALRARGALIRIGHDASSLDLLPGGATAVVTTHAAIPKTNPELVEARRRGIPVVLRPPCWPS